MRRRTEEGWLVGDTLGRRVSGLQLAFELSDMINLFSLPDSNSYSGAILA